MNTIPSPCVGACSTVYGDDYCRGCKRHTDEVTDWISYTDAEKSAIIHRLDRQLIQASADLFVIEQPELLQAKVQQYRVRCDFNRVPAYWLLCLLREGNNKIRDLNQYGVRLLQDISPSALFDQMDQAFYQQAFYQKL